MTVVINMHKTSFIFITCVMSGLWRRHVSLMHIIQVKCYWNELQFTLTFVKYIKIEILIHTVSVFHTDTT